MSASGPVGQVSNHARTPTTANHGLVALWLSIPSSTGALNPGGAEVGQTQVGMGMRGGRNGYMGSAALCEAGERGCSEEFEQGQEERLILLLLSLSRPVASAPLGGRRGPARGGTQEWRSGGRLAGREMVRVWAADAVSRRSYSRPSFFRAARSVVRSPSKPEPRHTTWPVESSR